MSNTLKVSDIPFLMKQWSPENETDPATVSAGSHNKHMWKCKECGYTWEASVKSRYKAEGKCPCHESNKVILPNVNDVLTLLPELKNYYDTEKNEEEGIDISREGFDSSMVANWKCPECGREWKSNIRSRSKKENGVRVAVLCPHYNTVKRKKEDVPTVDQVPDLYKFWNKDKNPDASTVKSNSPERADWYCSNCGYEWNTTVVEQAKSTGKCACCELNMKVKTGINDLFTAMPEAKDFYDFEKNKDVDIYNMGVRNKELVWWSCPDCGYNWRSSIASRVEGKQGSYRFRGCQKCYGSNKIVPIATNKLLVKHWDFKLNKDHDINLTSVHCTDTAHWRCKDCGHTWEASIRGMHQSFQGCQRCNKSEYFISSYPDLIEALDKIFDTKENPNIDINKLRTKTNTVIHFHCKSCNHEWDGILGNRVRKNEDGTYRLLGCPVCDNNAYRRTLYLEEYPELLTMYNREKNNFSLEDLVERKYEPIKLIWDCPTCHRSFPATLRAMAASTKYKTKGCPFCSHREVVERNSFGDLHPELLDEYAEENETNPFKVYPNSKKEVLWRCVNNPEHTWSATFALRHAGGGPCPVCNRTRLIKGTNTFADVHSEYLDMYSENNERKADEIFYNSSLWLKWNCRTCHSEYGAYIKDVLSNDENCPYCSNRYVKPGTNDLKKLYPDIASMWSKNNELEADHVFPNKKRWALWNCPDCGGEYRALINEVVSGEYTCPYCDDRLILPKFNDFATRHPELMEEYNYIANYIVTDSNNISEKSNEPLWWICPKNPEHHYRMSPARKLLFQKRNKEACPYCKGLRRKKRHFI